MEVNHTPIPQDELEVFKNLPNIKVVFDVGARADVEYLRIKPEIQLHAFEPNPVFFAQLTQNAAENPNVYLNNYGLGDVNCELPYSTERQAFVGGEESDVIQKAGKLETLLSVKTLDWYVKEHQIEVIDFLKIDTEGFDFRVLLGGLQTIPKCRYIQYEHWNDQRRFHMILGQQFKMDYIGSRNVLCTRLW